MARCATGLCFHPLLLILDIMVVSVIIIILQVIIMVLFLTNEDEEEAGGGPICLFVCFLFVCLFVCLFVLTNEDKEEAGGGPESTRNSNSGHEQLSHRLLVVPFKYLYSFIKFTSQQKAREHKNLVCDST